MKLINRTHWNTLQLKAILMRVAREELDAEQRKNLTVTIVYTRRAGSTDSSGCAWVGSRRAVVRLSKHTPDTVDFAFVAAHEFAHIRGQHHSDMSKYYKRHAAQTYAAWQWARDFKLEVKEKKKRVVTSEERVEKKLSNVIKLEKKWTTKLKRAQTALKKLRRSRQYYEKRAAVSSKGAQ